MNARLTVTPDCRIADIASTDYELLTDSQDVAAVRDYFGNPPELADFGGFFVWAVDGEYRLVLGFDGIIPYVSKTLYRVQVTA